MDERWLTQRVYGTDLDEPDPQDGHVYVDLVGGPLDVTGWPPAELATGAALVTELGAFGPGGRACYVPAPGGDRWVWEGDMP